MLYVRAQVALYVAAYAYSQPKCEISIFSTGRRASKKLLHTIFKFIIQLPNGSNMINKYNQETLELKGNEGNDDFRTINSYPSKVAVSDYTFMYAHEHTAHGSYYFHG